MTDTTAPDSPRVDDAEAPTPSDNAADQAPTDGPPIPEAFAKLGLRPGDIVTAINGTPLNNPSQGARVFSELGNAQSISVTLERGGQQQNLTLDTSSLDFSDQATQ